MAWTAANEVNRWETTENHMHTEIILPKKHYSRGAFVGPLGAAGMADMRSYGARY
jgi:hypothetical protein